MSRPLARLSAVALGALLLLPAPVVPPAHAQVGGTVPDYAPPPKAPPPSRNQPGDADPFARPERPARDSAALIDRFAQAYAKQGAPRLAVFWNRQLSDTLTEWYSDTRLVQTERDGRTISGDLDLSIEGGGQRVTEVQVRRPGASQRPGRGESWDWAFQDGFLGPFLSARARMIDRDTIVRMTGADAAGADPQTVEARALAGKADLLVEILVADQARSTTGYELRARVIDVRDGRILGYVNSRRLRAWQTPAEVLATPQGFELPDPDDEGFGPQRAEGQYRATPHGFERRRRPPKVEDVAGGLAEAVMDSLVAHWERGSSTPGFAP